MRREESYLVIMISFFTATAPCFGRAVGYSESQDSRGPFPTAVRYHLQRKWQRSPARNYCPQPHQPTLNSKAVGRCSVIGGTKLQE